MVFVAASTESTERRSAARGRVVKLMRQQIAEGKLGLGSRLPIRTDLEKTYGVSHVTMQRVIDDLTRDGFVQSRGKLGTFVAEQPPFANTFALIFPFHPGAPEWTKFWGAMVAEAAALQQVRPLKLPAYFNVLQAGAWNFGHFKALVQHIEERRVGGLIFTAPPHIIEESPVVQEPGIPRVILGSDLGRFPDAWTVQLRPESFVNQALDYLAGRGRKRLAVLSVPGLRPKPDTPDLYTAAAKARGLIARDCWCQYVWQGLPASAENVVHLLLDGNPGTRPDALVIADDNLLEYALSGLMKAGVRIGEDVDVVAHANFPLAATSGYPVRRLGYRASDILSLCVDAIERQRNGERNPQMLYVDAVWGGE